jgi:hypothetical protein
MPDFKTALLILALGGGGPLLTYFGVAAPAQQSVVEAQAAAEILGPQLQACYERADRLADELAACRAQCP